MDRYEVHRYRVEPGGRLALQDSTRYIAGWSPSAAVALAERWLASHRADLSVKTDYVLIEMHRTTYVGRSWYRIEKVGKMNRKSTPKLKQSLKTPTWRLHVLGGGHWHLEKP